MNRRYLSLVLAALLVNAASAATAFAKTKPADEAVFAEKVRAHILKLGTGEASRVRVKLRDKSKLEGYVSEAGAESFTVVDAKTGAPTVVAYAQVAQAKGNNLSTGAKIAIGVGIAVLVLAIIIASSDFGPHF
jgi:hypothetical protein